ncbi:T9SS response regulator signal transducer PorX [Mangrovibacterium diazotrophicum]|uniref:Response regulator receiver domain-containing protein n=1 Tax=Mangrovibacterium diazotrophicum TaxID=1261403 RepID=A0A419WAH9_9BACT|nr:bifunctional response regulator/alkaline phosphatase family protein [Mangrovibacterium diazotrophicum]RKD92480.1 response regulator receiver domain-containing protein [Mangrovibacterium diazotrophicum]
MKTIRILWTDDEIDLLRPHIIFLEQKGYEVATSTNGSDAIDLVRANHFDIIFLDENMPGLTGLQTLTEIKTLEPNVPVVMITKSEEEDIMDQAIGSKIADYLIKPVNPKQILLSIKKNVDQHELVTRKTTSAYQSEFGKIGMLLNERLGHEEWKEVYRKLVFWELELSESKDSTMDEVLKMQKSEANNNFARYIKVNYLDWFRKDQEDRPLLSPDLFRKKVFPLLDKNEKVFVLVVDNLRYDQYRVLSKVVNQYFVTEEEELYYSILPTATMYARNAIFAGLMPSEIARIYPNYWEDDDNEGHKNVHEKELLQTQMSRLGRTEKLYFEKVSSLKSVKKSQETLTNILQNDLSVMVFNFVDMISHARTEMEVMKELASDEKAYRSLTLSWFNHSFLLELIKNLAENNIKVVVTTDHGTVRVNNALKVIGDRETVTNLRYKLGRNLNYNPKEVFEITQPEKAFLPGRNVSSRFIFACNDDFLAYPNNFNYYVQYYRDTFQHGGVSMEEMIVPIITLSPKG